MLKRIKISKIKELLIKLPRFLARHAFLVFLVFASLALISGGLLFYQYSILVEKIEPEVIEEPIQFEENLYQKILKEWKNRERKFEEAGLKEYLNPFRQSI